jgi:hypothetical protein
MRKFFWTYWQFLHCKFLRLMIIIINCLVRKILTVIHPVKDFCLLWNTVFDPLYLHDSIVVIVLFQLLGATCYLCLFTVLLLVIVMVYVWA